MNGRWGYADPSGRVVIAAQFDAAMPFANGIARVGVVDEELPEIGASPNIKWGFIDRTGRFRIPPRYDGAGQFSEGVAYAWLWEGERRQDGIVDESGKFTELPEVNDSAFIFHDGLARFQPPMGLERKYGYMDKTGRVRIPPQFSDSRHLSEGLAWVSVLKERKWLYGFIDKTGKVVIPRSSFTSPATSLTASPR